MKFTSSILSAASGSVGGSVYSRNRYGPYIRGRGIPVNPNTSRQQAVRAIFQTLVELWHGSLSAAQRTAWNLYASNVTVLDALGNPMNLTGFNHFIRTNTVALLGAVDRIDDAPTNFTLGPTDPSIVATVSEAAQTVSLAYNDELEWCDKDGALMQIAMSKPANGSVSFIPPTYRVAGYVLGDGVTPPTSPATPACPFVVTETQVVQVKCRILREDGRLSPPFLATSTVAA